MFRELIDEGDEPCLDTMPTLAYSAPLARYILRRVSPLRTRSSTRRERFAHAHADSSVCTRAHSLRQTHENTHQRTHARARAPITRAKRDALTGLLKRTATGGAGKVPGVESRAAVTRGEECEEAHGQSGAGDPRAPNSIPAVLDVALTERAHGLPIADTAVFPVASASLVYAAPRCAQNCPIRTARHPTTSLRRSATHATQSAVAGRKPPPAPF